MRSWPLMRTVELANAYEQLVEVAAQIDPTALGLAQRGEVEWTLCHVILSNGLLADAAHSIAGQGEEYALVVDNLPATDPAIIANLVASTTHAQRVGAVRTSAREFLSAVAAVPEESAAAQITFRVHDRNGKYITDSSATWGELMILRATQHLPAHTGRLGGYSARGELGH